ncbi:MAG: hypothetical protein QOI15_2362 [Pseudonocardiales bacterium]|jgi:hypothetical protein|nr:hypothetical protein [Pseudonocardiales bacterium]MDT4941422.1 hypothetical protein [Pseudonocardiales bacterium]
MAKHKARSLRGSVVIAAVLAACAALLLSFVGSGSAGAAPIAPGKKVQPKNSVVTGTCNMTVQSVNASTGQVGLRLAALAQPTSFGGYFTNAYTQVFCNVYDDGGNLVATHNPFRNGPTVPNSAIQAAVPFSNQYFVCGQAFVKLNNGNTSLTPQVCA